MLRLEENILYINLPEGKTQGELINILKGEIEEIEESLFGLRLKINGRLTTGMAVFLGHKLAHICKTVSLFDPKEKDYILILSH